VSKPQAAHVSRDDIEEAAARVFRREGYRAATMSQIAKEVGLHKTSLYHHIESKQELLVSIAKCVMVEPVQHLQGIAKDEAKPPRDRLYDAITYYMNLVFSNTDAIAVFDLYAGDIEDLELRDSILEMKRRYIGTFIDLVAECLSPSSSEKPNFVTYGILGMCSYVVTWYRPADKTSQDAIAHTFARAALRIVDST
jgi:AcrR family transcriptional regulator